MVKSYLLICKCLLYTLRGCFFTKIQDLGKNIGSFLTEAAAADSNLPMI